MQDLTCKEIMKRVRKKNIEIINKDIETEVRFKFFSSIFFIMVKINSV